ncbi:TolC family protein, partial [Verrucomicrobia bacterium]|nr:TolC family protein [Verrucomicrobiota bacterium]
FLRFITGDQSVTTSSLFAASLTQPLLRGGGYRVTMENLTQAERNVLYSLRNFVRFRQEFTVQVASAYYRVLLNREFARNAFLGLKNFRRNAEEERELAREGRRSLSQLGQLQQAELSAESQWIDAVRNYKQSLDDFKVRHLGMSAGTS